MRAILRELEWKLAPLLPKSLARTIGAIRGYCNTRRHYSQNGEDVLAARFFERKGIQRGYYADIGCFHPNWISNTKLLHDQGWGGLAADIDPHKMRVYRFARGSKVKTVCAAIVPDSSKSVSVYRFHKLWSELDTASYEVAQTSGRPFSASTVEAMHITDFLKLAERRINFLNIDVEGLDASLLKAMDFTSCKPELICYEGSGDGIYPSDEMASLLANYGYRHLFSTGPSHGFALI